MAPETLLKIKLDLLKDFKIKDILNFEDDFIKVCHSKKKILEDLEGSGKLDEIIIILVDKFFELKDNFEMGRTPNSSFLCAWNSWLPSYSMNQPDNFLMKLNCDEIEFSLIIYWIAKKILEKHANQLRSSSTASQSKASSTASQSKASSTASQSKASSTASQSKASSTQVIVSPKKKKIVRNRNSDRIYSLQRLGGGCLGEMWRVNKKRMQVYSKIRQGKKPLTQKQRDIAHKLYQISLSLRNMDQSSEDIPPALIQINQGGLLIPHVSLNPYIEKVHDLVVDEWIKWDKIKPGEVLKETMATLMNNEGFKEMFHDALSKITEIVNRDFWFDELEQFRKVYQRKMGHAKLGDLVRAKIQSRNDRKGKRGIGGQNLRCYLYRNTVKKPKTGEKGNRTTQKSVLLKQCKASKSAVVKKIRKRVPNDLVIESISVPNEPPKSVLPKKSHKIKKEATSTTFSSPKQSRSGRVLRRKLLMDEFIYQ